MKRSFKDEYGSAVDLPANAIAYELTNGGDLVRGKPHTWEPLKSHVWQAVQSYDDLRHLTQAKIDADVTYWLEWNEKKFDGVVSDQPRMP
jgi:hypothetical protein